ncbi:NAD-dependent epimerase [Cobetia sp. 10Alg 146]|uniref:NAD-dependent epimerase n=1 Tax=Cobetia sp. 10Alg 146 TaxID=3040019 RepID=UPI002448DBE1|nr:NAD-dependent epimerase [Cobetia sp. 10Alg 146]MDH2292314.1 NAD-dependent epimerase [Cobetia sp. 10Alg 146]
MSVLVTGAAGFIGAEVSKRLLEAGQNVIGIDSLNDYYDVSLKEARLELIQQHAGFTFLKLDLADREAVEKVFADNEISHVVHLAAQAGVRYSLENPHAYADANMLGFLNILEGCRHHKIEHLVYASSSSVYGLNAKVPFSTKDGVDHPVSLYAASKKSNELMAHTYSHLYGIPTTGLRFFTVYGPWGRPDMAMYKFTKAIFEGKYIDVYNHGDLSRDFTYIDDIVEGIIRIKDVVPQAGQKSAAEGLAPDESPAPYALYNIGNGSPVQLMDFISAVEKATGIEAKKNYMDMQPGDVSQTWADTEDFFAATGYRPKVGVEEGTLRFIDWYKKFYNLK